MQYVLIIIFGVMNSDYVSSGTERLGPYPTWEECVTARGQATITHTRQTKSGMTRRKFYVVSAAMCVGEPAHE